MGEWGRVCAGDWAGETQERTVSKTLYWDTGVASALESVVWPVLVE